MLISEKQIMSLIGLAHELDKFLEFNGQIEWSAEIAVLLKEIQEQQSEKLKVIE